MTSAASGDGTGRTVTLRIGRRARKRKGVKKEAGGEETSAKKGSYNIAETIFPSTW